MPEAIQIFALNPAGAPVPVVVNADGTIGVSGGGGGSSANPGIVVTGSITTQNLVPAGDATASSAVVIATAGLDTIGIGVFSTYTGALSVQGRVGTGPWQTLGGTSIVRASDMSTAATIPSAANGTWLVNCAGFSAIRVTGLAAVTGSADVSILAIDGNGISFAIVPNAVSIGAVTPGTAATALGKAEDAAHASGDVGILSLNVRVPATPAVQTSAAGDNAAAAVDSEGKVVSAVYAAQEHHWQAAPVTITGAASQTIKLAAGAAIRTYLTDIDIVNTSATAVRVDILDGAAVIRSLWVKATDSTSRSFTLPLRTSVNTALAVISSAAVTDLRVSANGYTGV